MQLRSPARIDTVTAVVVGVLGLEDRAAELTPDTQLFDAVPELDSMAVVEILVALEARFGISFAEDDVTAEAFASLASLTALVERKC